MKFSLFQTIVQIFIHLSHTNNHGKRTGKKFEFLGRSFFYIFFCIHFSRKLKITYMKQNLLVFIYIIGCRLPNTDALCEILSVCRMVDMKERGEAKTFLVRPALLISFSALLEFRCVASPWERLNPTHVHISTCCGIENCYVFFLYTVSQQIHKTTIHTFSISSFMHLNGILVLVGDIKAY